jgi:1-deoxy-D-xylulose-5-phosphate reductoisomerase
LAQVRELTFEEADTVRFPALALARQAMAAGGAAPTVLNAADEVAVAEFIAGRIGFQGIAGLVEATLEAAEKRGLMSEPSSLDAALDVDHVARRLALDLLGPLA